MDEPRRGTRGHRQHDGIHDQCRTKLRVDRPPRPCPGHGNRGVPDSEIDVAPQSACEGQHDRRHPATQGRDRRDGRRHPRLVQPVGIEDQLGKAVGGDDLAVQPQVADEAQECRRRVRVEAVRTLFDQESPVARGADLATLSIASLEHHHVEAALGEIEGGHETGEATADDRYAHVGAGGCSCLSRIATVNKRVSPIPASVRAHVIV